MVYQLVANTTYFETIFHLFIYWEFHMYSVTLLFHSWFPHWLPIIGYHSTIFFIFFKDLFIYYVYIQYSQYSACMPEEGTRSHYRWLWATMWLLGIELRTFGRAGSALNHWAISPVPYHSTIQSALYVLLILTVNLSTQLEMPMCKHVVPSSRQRATLQLLSN